jgi:GNAT superfamily N-acetyltransferase
MTPPHPPREVQAEETARVYLAMLELRPHIGSAEAFVDCVNRLQRPHGYRLVAVFAPDDEDEQAAAVAGFRVSHFLAWGHAMYCDDLSTRAGWRGRGYAGALIDWMLEEARRLGCGEFHLDSGVGVDRQDAHRLYFNRRMRITSHHFALSLR